MKNKSSKKKINKLISGLEDLGYEVRMVKGQFQSGHCLLRDQKIILINRYFDDEGKSFVLEQLYTELSLVSADE